jgi:nitrogen fixation NifU-like protein
MNLYQDHILDHYHNPRHFGLLVNPTHQTEVLNPTCGDKLTLSLIVDGAEIREVGFEGVGCAISIASASLLYDSLIDTSVADALTQEPSAVLNMTGLAISPGRMKCALLSLEALKKALRGKIKES